MYQQANAVHKLATAKDSEYSGRFCDLLYFFIIKNNAMDFNQIQKAQHNGYVYANDNQTHFYEPGMDAEAYAKAALAAGEDRVPYEEERDFLAGAKRSFPY